MKFDVTKIITVAAMALSIGGSILGGVASNRRMNDTIANKVAESLKNK